MSRAAIICALREVLHRQPTPEEYEALRVSLRGCSHNGRIHIPPQPDQAGLFNDIVDLKRNGWSVRKIARKLGVSKSHVGRVLRANCPIAGGEVGQQPA